MFDLGKIFDSPNTKEVRILRDMNAISETFERIAVEKEVFSEKKDASHFGATCAMYIARNMDDDGAFGTIFDSSDGEIEKIVDQYIDSYINTSEMNDEKAMVDVLLSYGIIQDVEPKDVREIVGDDF